MKKKKRLLIIFGTFFFLISICYLFVRDNRLYDRDKPNIFEIPGTATDITINRVRYLERCYMVQKVPNNNDDIKSMISDYISEKNLVKDLFSNGIDYVILKFYSPSMNLPVYFEENKSYYKMDDFIDHYTDNLILQVWFDEVYSEGEYVFHDND